MDRDPQHSEDRELPNAPGGTESDPAQDPAGVRGQSKDKRSGHFWNEFALGRICMDCVLTQQAGAYDDGEPCRPRLPWEKE